jgi:hypothetical protein
MMNSDTLYFLSKPTRPLILCFKYLVLCFLRAKIIKDARRFIGTADFQKAVKFDAPENRHI